MASLVCEGGKRKNPLPFPGKLLGRRIEGGGWDTTGGKIVPGEGEVQRVEAAGWQLAFVGAEIQNGKCVLYLFWLLALATSPKSSVLARLDHPHSLPGGGRARSTSCTRYLLLEVTTAATPAERCPL